MKFCIKIKADKNINCIKIKILMNFKSMSILEKQNFNSVLPYRTKYTDKVERLSNDRVKINKITALGFYFAQSSSF